MSPRNDEVHHVALILRDAAQIERQGGEAGHTSDVLDEVLAQLPRGERGQFSRELAVYLARALVAAVARGRSRGGR